MNIFQAIILGIIQGFTEFLPVSSSGHLLLAQSLFGIQQDSLVFEVILHLGTLIPVVIVYWKDIIKLIKQPFQKMTYLIVLGTLPAVFAALFLDDYIDIIFSGTKFLAFGFIITGFALLYADKIEDGWKKEDDIKYSDSIIIGIIQAIAIAPGISRSGSTIAGSLFRKLDRETAAKYSFLLSIPAILGGAVLEIAKIIKGDIVLASLDLFPMFIGFLAAMLSGYLAINFMLALIKKAKLKYFSIYVFILAAFILIDNFVLGSMFLK